MLSEHVPLSQVVLALSQLLNRAEMEGMVALYTQPCYYLMMNAIPIIEVGEEGLIGLKCFLCGFLDFPSDIEQSLRT